MAHESPSISLDSLADAADVDSYRLIQTLSPDRTFLCADASANIVVLVRLEGDCLHRGLLHPSIHDRLARVRELPHPRVATLRGVERWNGIACLVWVYLDGENWDEHLRQHPDQFATLASALVAAVGGLHDIGIVHGNISARSIIVRPDGQPWLSQVSPYLYADPDADISALIDLLHHSAECLQSLMAPDLKDTAEVIHIQVTDLLNRFDSQHLSLKELSQSLLELGNDQTPEQTGEWIYKAPSYRSRSLLGALAITVIAVILGLSLRRAYTKPIAPGPATFPSLKPEGRW